MESEGSSRVEDMVWRANDHITGKLRRGDLSVVSSSLIQKGEQKWF